MTSPSPQPADGDAATWDCGECGYRISQMSDVNDDHNGACSLHPDNLVEATR